MKEVNDMIKRVTVEIDFKNINKAKAEKAFAYAKNLLIDGFADDLESALLDFGLDKDVINAILQFTEKTETIV